MSGSRARILARLAAAPAGHAPAPAAPMLPRAAPSPAADRFLRFRRALEAWRGEIHEVETAHWPAYLRRLLTARGVRSLMIGPDSGPGRALRAAWKGGDLPVLVPYAEPVEQLKPVLLHRVDAGITASLGAIAETGSLILWPGPDEPRLLSLLPPIHVALVEAGRLYDTLADAMAGWADGMPTNALLISGPSKTADIEQTLAFGVHGPKELIVLVLR